MSKRWILFVLCVGLATIVVSLHRPTSPQWSIRPAPDGGVVLCLREGFLGRITSCGSPTTIQNAVEYAIDNGAWSMSFAHGVYNAAPPKSAYAWMPAPMKNKEGPWVWRKDWRR